MAAIFKKEGKYYIKFTDSEGFSRVMELREGRKYLMREFELRKRKIIECKNNLQNIGFSGGKTSIFFTTHNSIKGNLLGF